MPPRASFPVPGCTDQTYFFSGGRYARIRWVQGTSGDSIVYGPSNIISTWPSLRQADFDTVDAILPSPAAKDVIYCFRGTKYVKIRIDQNSLADSVLYGPKDIATEWPSLTQGGFDTVDAVLPSPVGGGVTYFFSGTQYIKVKLELVGNMLKDRLLFGPVDISVNWPALAKAGFETIDNAVPSQSDNTVVYFFSGDEYVKIKLTPQGGDSVSDAILFGPTAASKEWPSLVNAKFY